MSDIRDRVRQHRARLRAQGLRPIQIWVPDVRSPDFADQAHRQSRAVAASTAAEDDQAFVDAISDWLEECGVPRSGPLPADPSTPASPGRC
jgi:hypothetical protein